jgi:hypothetical protein
MVLLAVIRDVLRESNQTELAEGIHNEYLCNSRAKGDTRFKLLSKADPWRTGGDRRTLAAIIDGGPFHPEEYIGKAYRALRKKVIHPDSPSPEDIFSTILQKLSTSSHELKADHNDNPQEIFESINAKGKQLANTDLFRLSFFQRLKPEELDDVYYQKWRPVEDIIGEHLEGFIRSFLRVATGRHSTSDGVYSDTKALFKSRSTDESVNLLDSSARMFRNIVQPAEENNPRLRHHFFRFVHLNATSLHTCLLEVYREYSTGVLTEDQFVQILVYLENYLLRRWACNIRSNKDMEWFSDLWQKAKKHPDPVEGVRLVLISSPVNTRHRYPPDDEFKKALTTRALYAGSRGRGNRNLKFLLESLEDFYEHKETPLSRSIEGTDRITIEHVMPQDLDDEWKKALGPSWVSIHKKLVHTLGNLTLTGYNPELGRQGFEGKRAAYESGNFQLSKQSICRCSVWTAETITDRSEKLASIALTLWPNLGPDPTPLLKRERDTSSSAPKALVIMGERIPVGTWPDVLPKFLGALAKIDENRLGPVSRTYPYVLARFSRDVEQMAHPLKIENSAAYFCDPQGLKFDRETRVKPICQDMARLFGLGPKDFEVVTTKDLQSQAEQSRRDTLAFWDEAIFETS